MKIFGLIICLLFSIIVAAQPVDNAQRLSLQKCVQLALANNQDVNDAAFAASINNVNYQQAQAQMFPDINASVSHGLNEGRSINPSDNSYLSQRFTSANYTISASLSLWNGFKIQNYIRKTSIDKRAGQMDLQQRRDEITIQVIVAYLDILNQREQLNNLLQQEKSTEVQYNRLDTLDQNGAASPADLYDLKGQLSSNQIAVINQQNGIKSALITLFQLMNVPLNMAAVLEAPAELTHPQLQEPQSMDEIYAQSLATLPLIKAATFKHLSAAREIKIARADFYPYLQLGGGLGTAYSSAATKSFAGDFYRQETGYYIVNGTVQQPVYTDVPSMNYRKISYIDQLRNNYGANINLSLNIPLFNAFRVRANVKTAKIQEEQALTQLRTTRLQLKNTIGRVYNDVDAALKTWQKQQEQVAAYKEYFRISEVKFSAGAINSSEYLIAKNKLGQAETSLIAAKYNYIFKTKILNYYEGTLSF